jgi:transposase
MTQRRYKTGTARDQSSLLPARIEDYVSPDAMVRAIDAYVDTLDLASLGFRYADGGHAQGKGQPPYHPGDQLKLYLYGYSNKVRSSRCLERETHRNLEVIWLLGGLRPDFKTIADFRKDNAAALKAVNRDFVLLCRELGLYGGQKVAIDGSFFHGNASKASIYTKDKLDDQLKQLEEKIARYQQQLAENDALDARDGEPGAQLDSELATKLEALKERQQETQALKARLEASDETQVSTTDEDARLLNKGDGTVAGYNVQIVVDDEHKLIAASDVTNDANDLHQLHRMATMAKQDLDVETLEALADAGYFEAGELASCEQNGITAYVPEPDKSARMKQQGRLAREAFRYDAGRDVYVCPQGQELRPQGKPSLHRGKLRRRYETTLSQCRDCPLRGQCLAKDADCRQVYRSEHEAVVERHRQRMKEAGGGKMRERSGLVEHPFGTLKCRAGWTHFLVRGFTKVGGEWALMATCYNFGRVLQIIGFDRFREYCRKRRKKLENAAISAVSRYISRGFDALPAVFRPFGRHTVAHGRRRLASTVIQGI